MCNIFLNILVSFSILHIHKEISEAVPMEGLNISNATKSEFEFIVSIRYKSNDVLDEEKEKLHICGGTLLTKKHVLTAAHCVNRVTANELVVVVGSEDLRKGKLYEIQCMITFDNWAKYKKIEPDFRDNDIAIIQLKSSVGWLVKLGKLTEQRNEDFEDTTATTAGWGATDKASVSRFLLKADMNIISRRKCKIYIMQAKKSLIEPNLQQTYLCVKNDLHTLPRDGDSGSPLFINGNEIIGIHESLVPRVEPPCLISKLVALFVGVYHYRTFIEENIKSRDTCCCIM